MNEKKIRIKIKETNATIIVEEKYFKIGYNEVLRQRKFIEKYISKNSDFLYTLKPYLPENFAPKIIKRMAKSSALFGVGPMASVAGAIAHYSVKAMKNKGANFIIFENGGDIALFINRPINIGIYSGERTKDLAIKVKPKESIFGICTSSGKLGHSLSFGFADSVTVIAKDAIIADAAATAICNEIKIADAFHVEKIIKSFLTNDIESIIVIIDDVIGIGGNVPEFINLKVHNHLITIG